MPSQLHLLAYASIPIFLLATGLLALFSPTTLAALFGMPIQPHTIPAGFVQCIGGRNLTFGLISATFVRRGDWKAVRTMAGLLAVDGFVDGWVCWRYAGLVAAVPHFVAAVGVLGVVGWVGK